MLIDVTQIIPDGTQWSQVNTDEIERVHDNPDGHLTIALQSGAIIDIKENREWWTAHTK